MARAAVAAGSVALFLLGSAAVLSGSSEPASISFAGATDVANYDALEQQQQEHRQLTYPGYKACAADLAFYLKVGGGPCTSLKEHLNTDKQAGVFQKMGWSEGTGSWADFQTFDAQRKVKLGKGSDVLQVCFRSTEYLSFKTITIGDDKYSPLGAGKGPLVIDATKYISFVDIDDTSGGLPTTVRTGGIGYIHSGESLAYKIDTNQAGWYPVTYELARQCDAKPPKPVDPSKTCPPAQVQCGYLKACCLPSEKCYSEQLDYNAPHRALTEENSLSYDNMEQAHRRLWSGVCCPPERSCPTQCCADNEVCSGGSCTPSSPDFGVPTPAPTTAAPVGVRRLADEGEQVRRWEGQRIVL